jgi:hypothetical protein
MFENRMNPFENAHTHEENSNSRNLYSHCYNAALNQFRSMLFKGKLFRLSRKVSKRKQDLYDLNLLKPRLHVRGSSYAGIKVVSIAAIIGSEGRTADFDMEFHPLSESTRERWVSVAVAYLSRLPLPPVQLIQVGDDYFVRDGHHRISISRAFGQTAIDAEVIVWNAIPPFPWQPEALQANPGCALESLDLSA